MKQNVSFVELTVEEKALPLVSGYLQAYASKDQAIPQAFDFAQYSVQVTTPFETIAKELLKQDSDVYAFSAYVWNIRLIRRVLSQLMAAKPDAHFILGGPQVMHQPGKYLDATQENLVLCNGEGEQTFYEYLKAVTDAPAQPNLAQVGGLSFYREQTLTTTPNYERIKDLEEIPSPYLNNLFNDSYMFAPFETNRGCPFRCAFCYWGAATNDRVYKFEEERIREEISWIGQKGIPYVFVADANWGALRRDIPLSQHMADTAVEHGTPMVVQYCSSKNKPEKSMEITKIFYEAGVVASQSLSMQTLSQESLGQIDRQNIKLSAYMDVQKQLRDTAISSFIELIWPLPGETLDSFKDGVNQLCESKASTLIVYPHLLLQNTPLHKKRDEFGLVTRMPAEETGEQEIVIGTNDVDFADYQRGLQFYFSAHILHNMQTLPAMMGYLNNYGNVPYRDVMSAFVDYLLERQDTAIGRYFKEASEDEDHLPWIGKLVFYTLHLHRDELAPLLYEFVSSQPWWADGTVRTLFEIDLLRQPYIYSNSTFLADTYPFVYVNVLETTERGFLIELSEETLALLTEFIRVPDSSELAGKTIHLDHLAPKGQTHCVDEHGADYYFEVCHAFLIRLDDFLPKWTVWQAPEAALQADRILGEI